MDRHTRANLPARWAVPLALAPLLLLGVGAYWYRTNAPHVDIVGLEFAGTPDNARRIVGDSVEPFQRAISADWLFIVSYGGALAMACALGVRCFRTRRGRIVAVGAVAATAVVVLADSIENVLLWRGLVRLDTGGSAPFFAGARAAAAIKFSLLVPATLVAVTAVVATLRRARSPV